MSIPLLCCQKKIRSTIPAGTALRIKKSIGSVRPCPAAQSVPAYAPVGTEAHTGGFMGLSSAATRLELSAPQRLQLPGGMACVDLPDLPVSPHTPVSGNAFQPNAPLFRTKQAEQLCSGFPL